MANESTRFVVRGDVSIDWVLMLQGDEAQAELQQAYQWSTPARTSLISYPGGAAQLGDILRQTVPSAMAVDSPDVSLDPVSARVAHTYALWQQFPRTTTDKAPVLRMKQFLGVQRPTDTRCDDRPHIDGDTILVLDDANLGFRESPQLWPANPERARHVVLKMAPPLFAGQAREVLRQAGDRLTAYVSLSDLRRDDASIGQSLSWQGLATEIRDEVVTRLGLERPQMTVVSVGAAGAVLVSRAGPAVLVFDPLHQEYEWERSRPGSPIWAGASITAALAVDQLNAAPNPMVAVARGLNAMRAAHENGYLHATLENDKTVWQISLDLQRQAGDPAPFAIATEDPDGGWDLLPIDTDSGFGKLASRIVLEGEQKACAGMPLERIGKWMSVDRTEIESIRSLRSIVSQYIHSDRRVRPLNVAVFGPPGSGKSFAVKQMSSQWAGEGIPIDVLEFNVAQFADPADLSTSFQRIRDSAVRQRLPIVFWDEFDAGFGGRELGWLSRFLAPMQDGTFLQDGVERPIGNAVFVFAGGTHATLASFIDRAVNVPGAKATDFLSRLRGHVDVLGPNPRDQGDSGFVLRRALLIRGLLGQRAPQLIRNGDLNIDAGVLHALLNAPTYLHGARSIEAIIEMSSLPGRLRFERSLLPAGHQLAMHVNTDAFTALVHGREN